MAEERILDDISHRRFNPLRNSWVLVSPHRTKRPWQGQQETPSTSSLPAYDPQCYLCPSNARASGECNPAYSSTFTFVNDFSAVKESQPDYEPAAAAAAASSRQQQLQQLLLRAEPVKGKCFVICFNPAHNLTLADLAPAQIAPIIDTWAALYAAHLPADSALYRPSAHVARAPAEQYAYMQIFENKGAAMGCSNPHPHGQAWATTTLPEEPALELAALRQYRARHGRCLLCDYAATERAERERVVFENEHFLAVVPWWATWPFELLVLAKRCVGCLPQLSPDERGALAETVGQVARRYDNLFETSFPYSMGIHQTPLANNEKGETETDVHFHMHFYPPLLRSATVRKFLVGYEMLAEPQRDITPEQAAARLRALDGDVCYRQKLASSTATTTTTTSSSSSSS